MKNKYGIIGDSVEINEIISVVQQVAPTDITVLITGESGTGKDVFAKLIHELSRRGNRPMISVNAGAIPEGIIESELFGHERGAFTGASDSRKGYFELADGGTIFLDEIGELPLATQVKFLRVLETGEYMRVGSSIPRKVDVRIIAATNKELETEVAQGRFRPDLYFRLRSINIKIPPLRDRREDIIEFASEFAKQFSTKNKIHFEGFSPEALNILKNHFWPGNVRELRNFIESLIVIKSGKLIETTDLKSLFKQNQERMNRNLPVFTNKSPDQAERELILRALLEMKADINEMKNILLGQNGTRVDPHYVEAYFDTASNNEDNNYVEPVTKAEKRAIISALERFKGNRRLASHALNISERTLYRKIKEYNLDM
ncbi:MAG: sigma-54-dependent Fis family transcriptional regulator [Ignavibacteriales bacterium]|nr:sigma-54-dependent Fis family transcriptional regulator [Ignavibacteriales bacterium]